MKRRSGTPGHMKHSECHRVCEIESFQLPEIDFLSTPQFTQPSVPFDTVRPKIRL